MFQIRMGVPETEDFWQTLSTAVKEGTASKRDIQLYTKLGKALYLLSVNLRHPRLHSHDIPPLTARYGCKVWEAYIENNTPAAGRLFWIYDPGKSQITVIGLEPHPNDKGNAYKKITLSSAGEPINK